VEKSIFPMESCQEGVLSIEEGGLLRRLHLDRKIWLGDFWIWRSLRRVYVCMYVCIHRPVFDFRVSVRGRSDQIIANAIRDPRGWGGLQAETSEF
jgi:hypothetical protein